MQTLTSLLIPAFYILQATAQQLIGALPGSQVDSHGCSLDGGYQWCEDLNECVRSWETDCSTLDFFGPQPPIAVDPGFGVPVIDPMPVQTYLCLSSPCLNGGLCQEQQNRYTCLCDVGFTGVNCEEAIAPAEPPVISSPSPPIPYMCATWYDGCNTCNVVDGSLTLCSMMYCFTMNEPECRSYYRLQVGDVCQRFCENGSLSTVEKTDECPENSSCQPPETDTFSFDTCGSHAWTCVSSH
jgi:hypothetical protein